MKKLATIEKITKFEKHPNADRLNLITVKGWECVTASNYEVGDLVVYIQIDTTVPKADWSEFLFDKGKPDQTRARIKTIKLRGRVSQGLCLPVDVLGLKPDEPILESDDVTEELGIEKYQKPVPVQLSGEVVGNFPTHICPKTDEERIQNFPELIDEFKALDCDVYVSVKMDGCCDESVELKTEDGIKTIREICETKYSGKVECYNIDTDEVTFDPITNHIIKSESDDWFELETDDGTTIKLTGNHPVYLPELKCYRRVDELIGGEILLLR